MLVAPEFDEPFVANPKVMRYLVQHHSPDLATQTLPVGTVEPLVRPQIVILSGSTPDYPLPRRFSGMS